MRSRQEGAVALAGDLGHASWARGSEQGLQAAPWRPRRPGPAGGQRQAGGQTCRGNQLNKKRLLFKARKFEIFGQEEKRKETLAREGKGKKKKTKTRANGFETPPPPPQAFFARSEGALGSSFLPREPGAAVGVWTVAKGQKGCLRSPSREGLGWLWAELYSGSQAGTLPPASH